MHRHGNKWGIFAGEIVQLRGKCRKSRNSPDNFMSTIRIRATVCLESITKLLINSDHELVDVAQLSPDFPPAFDISLGNQLEDEVPWRHDEYALWHLSTVQSPKRGKKCPGRHEECLSSSRKTKPINFV
jgi:hypothetical protein